ncbi:GNAT family N-acetyltransferase [Chitinophaga horti]|uniref:GNAT family N-acetyltransferase n=1 Tax=Chitinophaga horti TaxID=2920382 RepID=A0ABY6IX01_9BACT|nr:GNAT family N-acetyltransferase [Chitinophaga horti]UYQ91768.1 GNAT family N-acetyltransferase [Chitinophaga horti]
MNTVKLADIEIRNTLQPGDLGYIAYLHGLIYAKEQGYGRNFEAYVLDGLKDFAKEYDPVLDRVWICEHDARIIGFLVAQHRGVQVQFRYFLFLPEYRGIGLGKKLMDGFISFMHERGFKEAYLWTTNDQHAAIALYTRYGFALTEEKASNAFDKELIERRYDLTLSTSL